MASFKYQGRNAKGAVVKGVLESASQESAVEKLMNDGIIPTAIDEHVESAAFSSIDFSNLLKTPMPLDVLVIFCRQLYSLTKAGVPLLRSMRGL